MGGGDALLTGQVGDGARELEDAVVGPRREPQPLDRQLHEPLSFRVGLAVARDERDPHVSVGVNAGDSGEARALHSPGGFDSLADLNRRFSLRFFCEFFPGKSRHLDVDVDAVEERTRDARAVALDQLGGAGARFRGVSQVAAGAGIHRRRQHEPGGEGKAGLGPADDDLPFLKRAPQGLQHVLAELG